MKRSLIATVLLTLGLLPTILNAQTVQQGLHAMENEKYNLAKSTFTNLMNASQNDPELLFRRGMAYYMLGAKDSAKVDFDKGAAMSTTMQAKAAFCFVGQGMLLHDAKSYPEAKALFTKALSFTDQKDARLYRAIASVYINAETKDIPEAMNMLAKALLLDKKSAENQILMGDAKMTEIGGAGKAVSYYEAAMELDPKNPIPPFKIGDIYYSARNYEEALLSFQKAVQIDSTFIPVYREMGNLLADMKRIEEAKNTFGKYVGLADNNIATSMRYAQFLYMTKDFKSTISLIDQILKLDSTNWKMYRLLGFSSFEQADYAKAVSSIQKVMIMAEPSKLIASDFEKLGKSYAKLRNEEQAVTNLNKALSMDSTNYDLHFDLGDVYYSSKKYALAASEYAAKINAKGGKAVEFNQLGLTQIKAKNYVAGDSAYAHLAELKPNIHLGYIGRARCASLMDTTFTTGQALPFYEQVITIVTADSAQMVKYRSDLIESYNYLGTFYIQTSTGVSAENNKKARQYFGKLLEIDPENKNAKAVLERK